MLRQLYVPNVSIFTTSVPKYFRPAGFTAYCAHAEKFFASGQVIAPSPDTGVPMSSSLTESIEVQPPPCSWLGSGVKRTPACWRSKAHCCASALVKDGVPTACGRLGLFAAGRLPPLFFITSGAPKQAESASAAVAAIKIRGFKKFGIGMTVKLPTKWLTSCIPFPRLVENSARSVQFVLQPARTP